jgi:hypothetical protein
MVHLSSAFAFAIFTFCTISTAVPTDGKKTSTIPLTRHVKPNTTARDFLDADRLRRRSLAARVANFGPLTNSVLVYTMNIQVGNQTFLMYVDTGSSNLWIGVSLSSYL